MAKRGNKPPAKSTSGLSDQLERELAARAYRKVMSGETPSAQERSALRRYEKQQEEDRRWQYYETIPQKHWREMSGRQAKVINEQAERYGIPFGGKTISLPQVVRAMHNFLADNCRRFPQDDDLLASNVASPALERYREERAIMARLDRQEREGELIPRLIIREGLERIAAILRTAGEALRQQFGEDAVTILNEALDEAEVAACRLCDEDLEEDDA
ncbi:hypothetical protein [Rubinisphaera margarita]|uniref:hypothetical protein n=1 Tax=Rubinisphaera margarita TaxID=2909586 RepID=UPI001EE96D82|nr:hypothetical protein [Rubinisphaera margarita]MCG6158337.1 hypothetical protein [Rubinisphaera margarita]